MLQTIRPLLISCLLMGLSSLWVGGNAWHGLTCSHTDCCHGDQGEPLRLGEAVPKQDLSDYKSHAPQSSPPASDHDKESCPICQWYSLCHATVTLPVILESNERLRFVQDDYSSIMLIDCLDNAAQPRAPPVIS